MIAPQVSCGALWIDAVLPTSGQSTRPREPRAHPSASQRRREACLPQRLQRPSAQRVRHCNGAFAASALAADCDRRLSGRRAVRGEPSSAHMISCRASASACCVCASSSSSCSLPSPMPATAADHCFCWSSAAALCSRNALSAASARACSCTASHCSAALLPRHARRRGPVGPTHLLEPLLQLGRQCALEVAHVHELCILQPQCLPVAAYRAGVTVALSRTQRRIAECIRATNSAALRAAASTSQEGQTRPHVHRLGLVTQ